MGHDNARVNRHGDGFLIGLLLGAAVGAGLALLLTPKSGREIRNDLTEHARKARETANKSYQEGRQRFEQAVVKGREAYEEARGGVRRTKEDIKPEPAATES
jgi:gas vesicle protein